MLIGDILSPDGSWLLHGKTGLPAVGWLLHGKTGLPARLSLGRTPQSQGL